MIELKGIGKSYHTGDFTQVALDDVSLAFRDAEFVAILGPSGSGKTTLLNIVGGLDHMDQGDLVINGTSTRDYTSADWDAYRNHRIGFVFQSYNLIPHQSVLSNVELALTLAGTSKGERKQRARKALEQVGLGQHVGKLPSQLSGGQMQRVAIARALVNDPQIVLADEPTGALDTETGVAVMDLLKEISQDRLVVMVTHNPELAERYATRIVRLADGRITADSDPYEPTSEDLAQIKADSSDKSHHASMSFLTALSLSFANLMSKKGRTFLTAFAGSIGIIGIAAILALSNGVNDYIARTEEDTLSSYPLTISKSSADLSSLFVARTAGADDAEAEDSADESLIPQVDIMRDLFATVQSNDLASLRTYLEEGEGHRIYDYASTVTYNYGIQPHIYAADTSEDVTQLSPLNVGMDTSMQMSAASTWGVLTSGGSAFQEMIDNPELLEGQYNVIAGRWPEAYDECVLVLSSRGTITDYTLYGIGVYDNDVLRRVMRSVSDGSEYEIPEQDGGLTYEAALDLTFRVLPAAAAYSYNSSSGTWTDMHNDEAFMRAALEDAIELHVVGIVQPDPQASAYSLTQGIAYRPELNTELIRRANEYEIVQQQLANPEVDVFTGSTFEELQEGQGGSLEMSDLFTIDQDALASAFSFDTSGINIDPSGMQVDTSSIDPATLAGAMDMDSVLGGISAAMAAEIASLPQQLIEEGIDLTPEQQAQVANATSSIVGKLLAAYPAFAVQYRTEHPEADDQATMQAFLASEEGQAIVNEGLAEFSEELQDSGVAEQVQAKVQSILQESFSTYLKQAMEQMTAQLSAALMSAMRQIQQQAAASMASSFSELPAQLQNAFHVDAGAFANAIQVNMTQEDLTSLLTNYMNASRLTYENNLNTLGYADLESPESIYIYPRSFEDKEDVLAIIDGYNEKMEAEGKDEQTITYSDIMGTLMSSVTDIVNTISLVLIAFVSISLVVSSIMIGIITYISVLERKKEIGILRAMGASKMNIANIFNAEAVIEGLIAGLFAIATVVLVSFPVNDFILQTRNVPNIMQLSFHNAAALVAISVILTLVAGLIPSSAAARRDPVEALRSE